MKATLIDRHQETPTVHSFLFRPEKPFSFTAGQFIRLTIPHEHPDNRGASRNFSVSHSPTEEHIMITSRFVEEGSTFKKAFLRLEKEAGVDIVGPFGRFTLPEGGQNCMFVTGGVGITPVRSMLKCATDKKLPNRLTLLYSNTTPEETIFKNLFDELVQQNPNLDIVETVTKPEDSQLMADWDGRTGRIDEQLVREHIKDEKTTIFYLCGPSSMLTNFHELLQSMGIAQESIKLENFPGY